MEEVAEMLSTAVGAAMGGGLALAVKYPGLRLRPDTRVYETIVIDSINKVPAWN